MWRRCRPWRSKAPSKTTLLSCFLAYMQKLRPDTFTGFGAFLKLRENQHWITEQNCWCDVVYGLPCLIMLVAPSVDGITVARSATWMKTWTELAWKRSWACLQPPALIEKPLIVVTVLLLLLFSAVIILCHLIYTLSWCRCILCVLSLHWYTVLCCRYFFKLIKFILMIFIWFFIFWHWSIWIHL